MNSRLAYGFGLLVGAATATAAWVRLAGHPPVAASKAQLAALHGAIRALEALPTRPGWDDEALAWPYGVVATRDDEDGTPQRRGQDGPLTRRDPAAGIPGSSGPAQGRTGPPWPDNYQKGHPGVASGGYVPGYTNAMTTPGIIHPGETRITQSDARSFATAWLEAHRREAS